MIEPFERFPDRYDEWFEKHREAYISELNAIKALLPEDGIGVEVGVGTGRFAAPLGIILGVEPSERMAEMARRRGIEVIKGRAESLPLPDCSADYVLMVTTICFVDDPEKALKEAYRVIKEGGHIIIGFVDRNSPIGREYEKNRESSVFYRDARFFSTEELAEMLRKAGFGGLRFVQTLFHRLEDIKEVEEVLEGYGRGSFVVVRGRKPGC